MSMFNSGEGKIRACSKTGVNADRKEGIKVQGEASGSNGVTLGRDWGRQGTGDPLTAGRRCVEVQSSAGVRRLR